MNTENEAPALPVISVSDPVASSLHARTTKQAHVASLLRAIDALIFLYLGYLYALDNLTFLLLLRASSQTLYVQIRGPPLANTTQITPVVFATFVCFVTHILQAQPEAKGWSSRGYIHGGLIVDFIGELGPVSKWRLILLDVWILSLQFVMLAIGNQAATPGGPGSQGGRNSQTIEAEEEGRRASADGRQGETEDGIEMQSLLPNGSSDEAPRTAKSTVPDDDDGDEDMIIVDIKQSLRAILQRNRAIAAAVSTGAETAPDRPVLAAMLARIAASRGQPG